VWIDVETAARRSGLDERHIRRLCAQEWFSKGLARQLAGKGKWEVREDADVRLGRVRGADDLPTDLKSLSAKNLKRVMAKVAILKSWEAYLSDALSRGQASGPATVCFLEELASDRLPDAALPATMKLPTDRTLRRWRAGYRQDGLSGLIDERGTNQEKPGEEADPFFDAVKFYLLDQRERSKRLCWELACKEATLSGWMTRSYKQTLRYIDKKIEHRILQRHRKGPKFANGNSEPYIERDYSTLRSNEIWCGDEHTFDVWVKYRGNVVRPYLVALEDMRSRKIVGYVISAKSADTDTILAALHHGCASHGAPENLYVDNGKVYDNRALSGQTKQMRLGKIEVDKEVVSGVLGGLGIGITHAIAFNAKAKPIERFFGTVCARFSKLQTTYCGKNPLSRPENLKSKLKRDQAPEFDDFVAAFNEWLEGDYHAREHTGDAMDGRTPATVFRECLVEKRTAPAEIMEVMLWKPSPPTKCGRQGVTCEGWNYGKGHPALHLWDGKEVLISIDPTDANRAAVREVKTGKLICFASANDKLPANTPKEQLKEALAEIRRENRDLHKGYRTGPRRPLNAAQRLHQDRIKQQIEADLATPLNPSLKPIQTPLNSDLAEVQRALGTAPPDPLKIQPSEPRGPSVMERLAAILDEEQQQARIAREAARDAWDALKNRAWPDEAEAG
jgi:hypothetical protein